MGFKHYYVEQGSGAPLIFLHGNGEDHTYFKKQIPFFSERFKVFALDTRGHGKSPRGTAKFSIEQFADDLKRFLDENGISKADILGFSDGGNIAAVFAMKYPQNVNRLILNGANLDGRGVKPSVQIPVIIGYKIAKRFAQKSEKALRKAELLGLMVNDPHLTVHDVSKIKARTLVIAGMRDMIKKSHTECIARHIPNAKLVFLEGDHFIAHKNPEAFNQAVWKFLSETH